jgi:predicted nucleic acid-binding protein
MASAFARKRRDDRLSKAQARRLWRSFRLHVREQYGPVPLDGTVLNLAERLLFRHPLRAYDAVQLASALRARPALRSLRSSFRFCTADRRLAAVATAERLTVTLIQ